MNKGQKDWNEHFLKYINYIVNHPNYTGLPIEKASNGSYKWIATADTKIGRKRIDWCINKAYELGFTDSYKSYPGMYADVMLEIHPTKRKVCQICGKEMSLYYHYPNLNFLKSLNKKFHTEFTNCDHISYIWDELISQGINKLDIAQFLINKGQLNLDPNKSTKDEIINTLEYACRKKGKKCLGPGAMSNFPDRYDGFHTYNRCCRATKDKGRSKDNLKSYNKDRRAYEYWSDGNIHAANQFMNSSFFSETSADHIGPISLGFIHDPHYIQPMHSSDNSSKRDRLQVTDIDKIIEIQNRTGICPVSWQSKLIWEYICNNYKNNNDKVATSYRSALKQNMTNFMYILLIILESCPHHGEDFLVKAYIEPKYKYFKFSYEFNEKGEIICSKPRHYTTRNQNETDRYRRVAIESVFDYNKKHNRNNNNDLTKYEKERLKYICNYIENEHNIDYTKHLMTELIELIENRLILNL